MQSIVIATSFFGFTLEDEDAVERSEVGIGGFIEFCTDEDAWLEVPGHGRFEGLDRYTVIVDVASCISLTHVRAGELDAIQGFEFVLIHELSHACEDDSADEDHCEYWDEFLIPIIKKCSPTLLKEINESGR